MMHVLDSHWDGPRPRLLATDGDRLVELRPEGTFRWTVGQARTCVGRFHDGGHRPCPDERPVGGDTVCARCAPAWAECVFEPRAHADGDDCPLCRRDHVVYVALYGGLPKVGLTQRWRLPARLREQGADAGFVLAGTDGDGAALDRRGARDVEQRVTFLHGIPQWRRHRETLPQLTRPLDWGLLETRARQLMDDLSNRWPVERALVRVEDVPLPVPLPSVPQRRPVAGEHGGRWVGAKGTHWFYVPDAAPGRLDVGFSPVAALKRSDLVGRWLTVDD